MTLTQRKNQITTALSTSKYRYSSIFPTALTQLDHIFYVIGNGESYSNDNGIHFPNYCLDVAKKERDTKLQKIKEEISQDNQRYESRSGESTTMYSDFYKDQIIELEKEYCSQSVSYYFDVDSMVAEHIEHINKKECNLYPYPIQKFSKILSINSTSEKGTKALAIACTKAWKEVMKYHHENKNNETTQQWIDLFDTILLRLENKNV